MPFDYEKYVEKRKEYIKEGENPSTASHLAYEDAKEKPDENTYSSR